MPNHDTPRILISRLSAVGDSVLTLPMLCALRAEFPGAYIAWVTERAAGSLLRGHRALDDLIVVPKGFLKSPAQVRQLRAELRSRHFDIALDPQSLAKSALVSYLSGAKRRIGFSKPRGRELSWWLNRELVTATREHLVDAQLELLQPLGIDSPAVQFDLPIPAAAEARVESILRSLHLGCDFIAINPGAGWNSRLWSNYRYGRVARTMGERYQVPSLVLWAGEHEHQWAKEIVACSGGRAVLAPSTSLPELAAIMRRSRMYLGSDTGPLHIAAAVGTSCVGLFGTTRPPFSGAYGPQHIALQKRYQDGTCRYRRRAPNDAMLEIDIDTVVAACEQLLVHENFTLDEAPRFRSDVSEAMDRRYSVSLSRWTVVRQPDHARTTSSLIDARLGVASTSQTEPT